MGKIATSPLLSRGSPNAHHGYINQKWLGGPHLGKIDTSPLLSQGSPTLIAGTNSKPARWPACGQNSYITPAVLGVPNTHGGEKLQIARSVARMWTK